MPQLIELSPVEARKLVLLSQGIHKERQLGSGKAATLRAIEKLGYVQIDTISVVERAHHHVLWSRVPSYRKRHLHELQQERAVFEYWSHAAAYLPMRDFRYSLPRKAAIAGGEKHWFVVAEKVLQEVLARVRAEGPLQSKDFDSSQKMNTGWGDFKIAKRALEQLFMRGDLMIAERRGFQKVYDIPERVLPANVDTSMPSERELLSHLILSYLRANGLGSAAQTGHLRKGIKPKLRETCDELVEEGQLAAISVQGREYYALADYSSLLSQALSRQKVKILSPFDNLLIQRERTRHLFGFDYQIECYVTAKKRVHGYFVLPVLWGQKFAGRMDAKIDRKSKKLTVHKLFVETGRREEFLKCLAPVLDEFCAFNGGEKVVVSQIVDL